MVADREPRLRGHAVCALGSERLRSKESRAPPAGPDWASPGDTRMPRAK